MHLLFEEINDIQGRLIHFGLWKLQQEKTATDAAKAYRYKTLHTDLDRLAAIVVELRAYAEEV